ncbi:MAG: TonB-dependent receptor plug domain-containing protein, partial [Campylobacterales bacterium]|nr:TonB-dependent receptor plug domain-containing protein [Campylobacterales bacterium]
MINIKRKIIPLSLCLSMILGSQLFAENTNTLLEEITISQEQSNSASNNVTEGKGSYTTKSMNTATKLDLSIRETPQSIVVITKQQMEDFNYTSLEDIINNTAGLNPSKFGTESVYMT